MSFWIEQIEEHKLLVTGHRGLCVAFSSERCQISSYQWNMQSLLSHVCLFSILNAYNSNMLIIHGIIPLEWTAIGLRTIVWLVKFFFIILKLMNNEWRRKEKNLWLVITILRIRRHADAQILLFSSKRHCNVCLFIRKRMNILTDFLSALINTNLSATFNYLATLVTLHNTDFLSTAFFSYFSTQNYNFLLHNTFVYF